MLPPLATPSDAAALGYSLPAGTAQALLTRASTRIRTYTKQQVTRVTDDVQTYRITDGSVRLPQRPADKPTVVLVTNQFGLSYPLTYFTWDGWILECPHKRPSLYWQPWNIWALGWTGLCLCTAFTATVTYSHGFTVIPDGLLDVTCSIAERISNTAAGMESGVRSEGIGDYTVTFSVESLDTASGLLPGEKQTIDGIFGNRSRTSTIQMR
jgi:hypothetical protein